MLGEVAGEEAVSGFLKFQVSTASHFRIPTGRLQGKICSKITVLVGFRCKDQHHK